MRTKTLLLSAAAIAAGLATSMAQSNIYSVNVVGYVNQVIPPNQFVLVSNPLDDGTNTITSLGAALPNKTSVQVWNVTGFNGASKGGGVWNTNIAIAVGQGFFIKTPATAGTITNTFVGNVIVGFGGSVTSTPPAGQFSLVGSPIPFAGNLNDAAGTNALNIGAALPNKSTLQVWNINKFDGASKGGGVWNTNIALSVGQGFFVKPNAATTWTQNLQ